MQEVIYPLNLLAFLFGLWLGIGFGHELERNKYEQKIERIINTECPKQKQEHLAPRDSSNQDATNALVS